MSWIDSLNPGKLLPTSSCITCVISLTRIYILKILHFKNIALILNLFFLLFLWLSFFARKRVYTITINVILACLLLVLKVVGGLVSQSIILYEENKKNTVIHRSGPVFYRCIIISQFTHLSAIDKVLTHYRK